MSNGGRQSSPGAASASTSANPSQLESSPTGHGDTRQPHGLFASGFVTTQDAATCCGARAGEHGLLLLGQGRGVMHPRRQH